MMNLPTAETFGDIPICSTMSQGDDFQSLLRLDTKELILVPPLNGAIDNMNIFDDMLEFKDIAEQQQQYAFKGDTKPYASCADHLGKTPEIQDVTNPSYGFNVVMKGNECSSSSWCYSTMLKKLYAKKKNAFTVDVSYRNSHPNAYLMLRIMLVCSSPQDIHRTIHRCHHDIAKDHEQATQMREHIVRCVNPSTSNYVGHAQGVVFKDRLAVIIPLEGIGEQLNMPVSLEFMCQNSCPTIERRATALVFTLENEHGAILGRKSISVKICSCPKRDMAKEEGKEAGCSTSNGKRKHQEGANDATVKTEQQPPRKITRQSSLSGVQTSRNNIPAMQGDASVPSTSSMVPRDQIKKETSPYPPLSRSSSTVSSCSVENLGSAIMANMPMHSIGAAVEMYEYAFKLTSAEMVRCTNEEKRSELAKYLAFYRRQKRILMRTEENAELHVEYDSD